MDNLKQIRFQQRFPNFEKSAEDIDRKIKEIYFPILKELYKKFKEQWSDVDPAIKGAESGAISRLSGILNEEKPLPCFFDLVNYDSLPDNKLKKDIDSHGRLLIKY